MKITTYTDLTGFEFWNRVKYLTDSQLDEIQAILEQEYPDGIDETELNDLFWFEEDYIAELLGCSDFEELLNY